MVDDFQPSESWPRDKALRDLDDELIATRDALQIAVEQRDKAEARVKELEDENVAELRAMLNRAQEAAVVFARERDAARERVKVLEDALRFYGDDENYRMRGPLNPEHSGFEGTSRARAALSQVQEKKDG